MAAERVLDFASVLAGALAAVALGSTTAAVRSSSSGPLVCGVYALVFVFLLDIGGEYRLDASLLSIRETERWLRATSQSTTLALLALHLKSPGFSWRLVLSAGALGALFLVAQKLTTRQLSRMIGAKGWGMCRAVVLGAGPLGREIYSALRRSPKFGIDPVAFVDEEAAFGEEEVREFSYRQSEPARILAGPISNRLIRNLKVSTVIVADPQLSDSKKRELAEEVSELGVHVMIANRNLGDRDCVSRRTKVDGLQLDQLQPAESISVGKRTFDLIIAAMALCVFWPVMLAISLYVKVTSPGPVLYRQRRIGKGGAPFTMYKFRTMHDGAPSRAAGPKAAADYRIIRGGAFLRRSSLDELPQLFNVLRGEMSLVGPRPEMLEFDHFYTGAARSRFEVKPGLLGLWQLTAARNQPIFENLEYDLYYAANRNLFMDTAILIHSLAWFARGR